MLDIFWFCIKALLPIIALTGIGYLVQKTKIAGDFLLHADKYVFRIALPTFLFFEIATMKIDDVDFDFNFVLFVSVYLIIIFLLLNIVVPKFIKNSKDVASFIQGTYRSNVAILGPALAFSLGGDGAKNAVIMLLPIVIPTYNILTILMLAKYQSQNVEIDINSKQKMSSLKIALDNIIKNPLIWACFLAIPVMFLKIDVRQIPVVSVVLQRIADTSTPVALMSLGAAVVVTKNANYDCEFDEKRLNKLALSASIIRIVLIPLTVLFTAYLLGFEYSMLISLLVLIGTPTAVSSFIMAKNMGANYVLSARIVLISTLLSAFTIFMFSFVINCLFLTSTG